MGKSSRSTQASLEVLLQHRDWLQRLAQSLVADANLADDIVQATSMAAIKNVPPENPRAWLATVAKNRARTLWQRKVKVAKRERKAARLEGLPPESQLVDQEDTRRLLISFVQELKDPYRSTLLLHFFEGLGYDEVAVRKNITESAVRSHIRRGLDQLRVRLQSQFSDRGNWAVVLLPLAKGNAPVTSSPATISKAVSGLGKRALRYSWAVAVVMFLSIPAIVLTLPGGQEPSQVSELSGKVESFVAADSDEGRRLAIEAEAVSKGMLPMSNEPSTDPQSESFLVDLSGPAPSSTESLPKTGKIDLGTGDRASDLSKTTEKPRKTRPGYSPKITPQKPSNPN